MFETGKHVGEDRIIDASGEMAAPADRLRAFRVLVASALAQGTEAYCIQGIPVLLYFIRQDISLTAIQLGAVASAPYLANVLFCLVIGQYLEKWGSKTVIFVALLVMGIGMIMCSRSSTYLQFYFGLIIAGLGFTAVYPGTTKAVMENTPDSLKGTFIGLKQMGVTLGAALGAAVLPVAATRWSWQASLVFVGILVIFTALAWRWVYGTDVAATRKMGGTSFGGKGPILLEFLRRYGTNKALWLVNLMGMGLMSLQMTTCIWLPTYLKEALFWDPVTAGKALACLQIGGALGRGSLGAISDALGRNRSAVAAASGAAAGACVFLLSRTGAGTSVGLLYALALVTGYFALGWVGVGTVMRAELLPGETGKATSFGLLFMALGAVLGPPIFGRLTAEGASYGYAWICMASVGVLASVLAILAGRAKVKGGMQRQDSRT